MSADAVALGALALFRREGDLSWQDRALCAETDPDEFFPDKGGSTASAKRVCWACDVQTECLDYALRNSEPYGIWGGLSTNERHAFNLDATPRPRPERVTASRRQAAPVLTVVPEPEPEPAMVPEEHAPRERPAELEYELADRSVIAPDSSVKAEAAVLADMPAPAVKRCRRCGYLTTAPGHLIICGEPS